ncbi:MAG: hypothetical protein ACE5OP_10160 [Candidatus Glassbacteria bacterium]
MKTSALVVVLCLMLMIGPASGHDLHYKVTQGEAIVIRLFHPDNTSFSNESYEIFREGEKTPFQVGDTDANGRITFIPDEGGDWRIRVFSEDGHGMDITLETDELGVPIDTDMSLFDRYSRILVGIAIILGGFAIINLFYRRRVV